MLKKPPISPFSISPTPSSSNISTSTVTAISPSSSVITAITDTDLVIPDTEKKVPPVDIIDKKLESKDTEIILNTNTSADINTTGDHIPVTDITNKLSPKLDVDTEPESQAPLESSKQLRVKLREFLDKQTVSEETFVGEYVKDIISVEMFSSFMSGKLKQINWKSYVKINRKIRELKQKEENGELITPKPKINENLVVDKIDDILPDKQITNDLPVQSITEIKDKEKRQSNISTRIRGCRNRL